MTQPDLSIVIPTYNRAHLLKEALPRLRAQGLQEAEIVVVDDESQDDTASLFPALDPAAKFVRQKNTGPAGARNRGAKLATGRYLAFLDSDDSWAVGRPRACIEILDRHPEIDVLFCETQVGNAAEGYESLSDYLELKRDRNLFDAEIEPGTRLLNRGRFFERMLHKNQVFLGSTIIHRSAWDQFGEFDEKLFGGEDYELCLRYSVGAQFAFCETTLAHYEKHEGGLSANRDRMAREFALAMERMPRNAKGLSAEQRELARDVYCDLQFGYSYLAYDRGDRAEARRRFGRLLRIGGIEYRSAQYWLACIVPSRVLDALRHFKRKMLPQPVPTGDSMLVPQEGA